MGKGGRKRGRATSIGCLLYTPQLVTEPQPRHVPWLGIEPTRKTSGFAEDAQPTEQHLPGLHFPLSSSCVPNLIRNQFTREPEKSGLLRQNPWRWSREREGKRLRAIGKCQALNLSLFCYQTEGDCLPVCIKAQYDRNRSSQPRKEGFIKEMALFPESQVAHAQRPGFPMASKGWIIRRKIVNRGDKGSQGRLC